VKTKKLTAACTVFALAMSFAAVSYAEGDGEEPPTECRCEEPTKGNNGWGNGPDTTNAGSFSGGTAETKSVNGLGPDKFDGKFEGR
jgi:hypothetical protein